MGRSRGMEHREVVWVRERWRWAVGVGAAADVDAILQRARHWAELARQRGRARLAVRVGARVGDVPVGTQ